MFDPQIVTEKTPVGMRPRQYCDFPPPKRQWFQGANGLWYSKAWTPDALRRYWSEALTKPVPTIDGVRRHVAESRLSAQQVRDWIKANASALD